MKRKKWTLSQVEVQRAVDLAEKEQTFANRGELYAELSKRLNVPVGTLAVKIGDMGIKMMTLPGKRGRIKGCDAPPRTQRVSRAAKIAKFDTFDQIAKTIPETYAHYVEKAKKEV